MIKIICVGKIKEKYYIDAIKEYQKRLQKYCKLEIIECNDYDLGEIDKNKTCEKEEILKKINDKDQIITMEIEGKMLSSVEFAQEIEKISINHSNITFIIGGSYGIDDEIKKISNLKLSFSKLTFPHQLFRVILLEQLYRVYKINNNESYHK